MKSNLLFAAHHKCATQFLRLYLNEVCKLNRLSLYHSHRGTSMPSAEHDFSLLTNADYRHLRNHTEGTFFHILRNPLSIITSAYYSHRYSHPLNGWPELTKQRELLEKADKETGMWLTLEFLEQEEFYADTAGPLNALHHWDFDDTRFRVELMESITAQTNLVLQPIFLSHFGKSLNIPNNHDFNFISLSRGRRTGEKDVHSHYRSGRHDDWKSELPKDLIQHVTQNYSDIFQRFYPDVEH